MDCCEKLTPEFTGEPEIVNGKKFIGRRGALKRLAGLAGGIIFVSERNAYGQGRQVLLAFCGQLLCVIPYEVTRARGHFKDEGLDVRLVYTRGGNVAMQALVGGSVDYAGTSFDVALQAYARGAKIARFASTGRLPLFALASAPKTAKEIRSLQGSGKPHGRDFCIGQRRTYIAAVSHEARGRGFQQSAFCDSRHEYLGRAQTGPSGCRDGPGAGVELGYRGGRPRDFEYHGYRGGQPPPRRSLRVHGRGGTPGGTRAAPRRDGAAFARAGQRFARYRRYPRERSRRRAAQGAYHRRQSRPPRGYSRTLPPLALSRQCENRSCRG